jgi:hypothetical protein
LPQARRPAEIGFPASARSEQKQRIVSVKTVQIGYAIGHAGQHSHMSEVYAINAAGSRLTDEILDFVKTGK